jgi:hypothetical protein
MKPTTYPLDRYDSILTSPPAPFIIRHLKIVGVMGLWGGVGGLSVGCWWVAGDRQKSDCRLAASLVGRWGGTEEAQVGRWW